MDTRRIRLGVGCKRLHNEELRSFYRSSNNVKMIKSKRIRLAGHVVRMEEGRRNFKIIIVEPT